MEAISHKHVLKLLKLIGGLEEHIIL